MSSSTGSMASVYTARLEALPSGRALREPTWLGVGVGLGVGLGLGLGLGSGLGLGLGLGLD